MRTYGLPAAHRRLPQMNERSVRRRQRVTTYSPAWTPSDAIGELAGKDVGAGAPATGAEFGAFVEWVFMGVQLI